MSELFPSQPQGAARSSRKKFRKDDVDRRLDAPANLPANRSIPHNLDAEEGLIACFLRDPKGDLFNKGIESRLLPESFYSPANQRIFEAMCQLNREGKPVEEILLAKKLAEMNELEACGGPVAIARLGERIETTAHFSYWLDIVVEAAILRRIIATSTGIVDRCFESNVDSRLLLEDAEKTIFSIGQARIADNTKHVSLVAPEAAALVKNMLQRRGDITGVATGFTVLDKLTFGFHPQEMIVLAARPSVGKTSFVMNVAENVLEPHAPRTPQGVLVFSLEMGAEQLAMRMLCSMSGVDMKRLKDGAISRQNEADLASTVGRISKLPLWIDDSSQTTIMEIRAKARRICSKNKVGIIIIDYLQLISGSDPRMPREQQIAEISRGVKGMAKELKLPVVVLSQLNRESEKERRPPRLSDLRESGAIEQDADLVILLARNISEKNEEVMKEDGIRSVIVAKNRNGPIGTLRLAFIPGQTKFANLEEGHGDNELGA